MSQQKISEHFTQADFNCRCRRDECDAPKTPDADFVARVERARVKAGVPFVVNSWVRCRYHNAQERGSDHSFHLTGFAIDISCRNSRTRAIIVTALLSEGFSIKIYNSFIHADFGRAKQIIFM